MVRRPIDKIRESAGSMEIRDPDDPSPISGFLQINDERLFVIKEKGVFEILMADNIDPNRKNPEIPNTYKKVLDCGSAEESFWRILMLVDHLCNKQFLDDHIDRGFVIDKALSLQSKICTMKETIDELSEEQCVLISKIERQSGDYSAGFALPQILRLEEQIKLFHHNAWKCFKDLFSILSHAFHLNRAVALTESRRILAGRFGEDDAFVRFLDGLTETFEFFRKIRNSIEHPKVNERLDINNFTLDSSGEICVPSMLFVFKDKTIGPVGVADGLAASFDRLVEVSECFLAYIFSYQANSEVRGVKAHLIHFPEGRDETRRYRYGWGVEINGEILPLG